MAEKTTNLELTKPGLDDSIELSVLNENFDIIDAAVAGKVDKEETYTKTETDQRITAKVAEIVADAPEDFDTLKELSDWITSHSESAATMNSAISANTTAIAQKADKSTTYTKTEVNAALDGKVDKVVGKQLSTNDFTNADKSKLDSLENYDDTDIKADVAEVASQAAVNKATLGYQTKNLLNHAATSRVNNGITYTVNEDGSVTANGTATATSVFILMYARDLKNKELINGRNVILSGCPSGGGAGFYKIQHHRGTADAVADYGSGVELTFDTSSMADNANFAILISKNQTVNNLTFYPMLRYAEITDDTYEPYKPSVQEQIDDITSQVFGVGITIPSNADLNDYTTAGVYKSASSAVSQSISNTPYKTGGFRLEVNYITGTGSCTQIMYPNSSALGCFFTRVTTGGTVGQWFKHQGEAVTTT